MMQHGNETAPFNATETAIFFLKKTTEKRNTLYSSTQQIVALSTAESEYISITKGAVHALEVRNAMVESGKTFNLVCETDAWAGRAMARSVLLISVVL